MTDMERPPYYYDEEEQPRRRSGGGAWGFFLGLVLGLGLGFWGGRSLTTDFFGPGFEWALAAIVPLVMLIAIMGRFRQRVEFRSLPEERARGLLLVMLGLILATGIAVAMLATLSR